MKQQTGTFGKRALSAVLALVLVIGLMPAFPARAIAEESASTGSGRIIDADIDAMLAAGNYIEGDAIAIVRADLAQNSKGFSWPWASLDAQSLLDTGEVIMSASSETAEEALDIDLPSAAEAVNDAAENGASLSTVDVAEDEAVEVVMLTNTGKSTRELLEALLADERVIVAEPNYTYEINDESNLTDDADPAFGQAGVQSAADTMVAETSGGTGAAEAADAQPNADEAALAADANITNVKDDGGLVAGSSGSYDLSSWQWGYDKNCTALRRSNDTGSTLGDGTMGITGWNGTEENAVGVVAILDTGIDYKNADLAAVMIDEANGAISVKAGGGRYGINATGDGNSIDDCQDYHGHGSHCAGIAAAEWNGYGTSGAANGAQLLAVRGAQRGTSVVDTIGSARGYEYLCRCVNLGMNLVAVNNSWGSDFANSYSLSLSVTKLGKLGVVSVFAPGNADLDNDIHASTATSFAENPYVVSVNSARHTYGDADYTSYGQVTSHVYGAGSEVIATVAAHQDLGWHVYGPADTNPVYRNYFTNSSDFQKNIWISKCTVDGSGTATSYPTSFSDLGDFVSSDQAAWSDKASVDPVAGSGSLQMTANGSYWVAVPVSSSDVSNINAVSVHGYSAAAMRASTAKLELVGSNGSGGYEKVSSGGSNMSAGEWLATNGLRADKLSSGYTPYVIIEGVSEGTALLLLQLTVSGASEANPFYIDCLTVHSDVTDGSNARSWMLLQGTSMSSPAVAGCVAVVAKNYVTGGSQTASQTAIDRANYLKAHVVHVDTYVEKCTQGGMVDLRVTDADATPVVNKADQSADGTVVLTGAYFGYSRGTGSVKIGGAAATVKSWSNTKIEVTAAGSVASGEQLIEVTANNNQTGRFKMPYQASAVGQVQAFEETLASPDTAPTITGCKDIDGLNAGAFSTGILMNVGSLAEAQGRIFYVALDSTGEAYKALFCYNPTTNEWETPILFSDSSFFGSSLRCCSIASYDDLLYIFGMKLSNGEPIQVFASYNPQTGDVVNYDTSALSGSTLTDMKHLFGTLVAADGGLMLVGGVFGSTKPMETDNVAKIGFTTEGGKPAITYQAVGTIKLGTTNKMGIISPQVAEYKGALYVGCFETLTAGQTYTLDPSLFKVTKGSDGTWTSQDISSTLPTLLTTPDYTTTTGYLPSYSLASGYDSVKLSGANVDAGGGARSANDTYLLADDAATFTAYGRSASLGALYYPTSVCAGGYLYTMGATKYDEGGDAGAMVFRRTAIEVCTVSFDVQGHGTAPAAQKMGKGETATAPADPTADGYAFAGWYTEVECTNAFDFTMPITADTTLYASWKQLTIDAPDGSAGATANKDDLAAVGTAQAKKNPAAQSVAIKLDVAQGADSAADEALVRAAAGSKQVVMYGVHLGSQIDGGELTDIGSDNDVLVRVTYALDQSKATDLETLRVHKGALSELTSTPNEAGEYVGYDSAAGTITVCAKNYSTYAFAYTPVSDDNSAVTTAKTGDPTGMFAALLAVMVVLTATAGACALTSRRRREGSK